ncbi:MAG: 2-amino-4-hydroxy-6-hydroxymethyldihydropteridine diphosphokinase [Alistipes sp.]
MKDLVKTVILGGGNIGDVESRLAQAERLIGERAGEVAAHSALHTSKAWGFKSQNDFLNRAFVVFTPLTAEQLLDVLQGIERELGRDREQEYREKLLSGEPYASRKIDLDILLYGDNLVTTDRLHIPHPRIMQREFALEPLCEVTGMTREQIRRHIETIATK